MEKDVILNFYIEQSRRVKEHKSRLIKDLTDVASMREGLEKTNMIIAYQKELASIEGKEFILDMLPSLTTQYGQNTYKDPEDIIKT